MYNTKLTGVTKRTRNRLRRGARSTRSRTATNRRSARPSSVTAGRASQPPSPGKAPRTPTAAGRSFLPDPGPRHDRYLSCPLASNPATCRTISRTAVKRTRVLGRMPAAAAAGRQTAPSSRRPLAVIRWRSGRRSFVTPRPTLPLQVTIQLLF